MLSQITPLKSNYINNTVNFTNNKKIEPEQNGRLLGELDQKAQMAKMNILAFKGSNSAPSELDFSEIYDTFGTLSGTESTCLHNIDSKTTAKFEGEGSEFNINVSNNASGENKEARLFLDKGTTPKDYIETMTEYKGSKNMPNPRVSMLFVTGSNSSENSSKRVSVLYTYNKDNNYYLKRTTDKPSKVEQVHANIFKYDVKESLNGIKTIDSATFGYNSKIKE